MAIYYNNSKINIATSSAPIIDTCLVEIIAPLCNFPELLTYHFSHLNNGIIESKILNGSEIEVSKKFRIIKGSSIVVNYASEKGGINETITDFKSIPCIIDESSMINNYLIDKDGSLSFAIIEE